MLTVPLSGTGEIQARVAPRRWDTLSVKLRDDLATARALRHQSKNTSYHRRGPLVRRSSILLRRVHLITIYRFAADKQSFSLFVLPDTGDLFGDVLYVHVVYSGPGRRDLVGIGVHIGVDAVRQRDVPHTVFREAALHITAGYSIVVPRSGWVLDNRHVHPPGLNVPQHLSEFRTIES